MQSFFCCCGACGDGWAVDADGGDVEIEDGVGFVGESKVVGDDGDAAGKLGDDLVAPGGEPEVGADEVAAPFGAKGLERVTAWSFEPRGGVASVAPFHRYPKARNTHHRTGARAGTTIRATTTIG